MKLKTGDHFCISYAGTRCHVEIVDDPKPANKPMPRFCGCYQIGKQVIDVYYTGGALLDIFAFKGVIKK